MRQYTSPDRYAFPTHSHWHYSQSHWIISTIVKQIQQFAGSSPWFHDLSLQFLTLHWKLNQRTQNPFVYSTTTEKIKLNPLHWDRCDTDKIYLYETKFTGQSNWANWQWIIVCNAFLVNRRFLIRWICGGNVCRGGVFALTSATFSLFPFQFNWPTQDNVAGKHNKRKRESTQSLSLTLAHKHRKKWKWYWIGKVEWTEIKLSQLKIKS